MPGCSSAQSSPKKVQQYGFKVEETLPHDSGSYTQGLFFHNGELYESAGQYGESSMRKVDLSTGKVVRRENFEPQYFVEGSCAVGDNLYILTWREGICFVYDINTFQKRGQFRISREGWGLTTDGKELIMSTGSEYLFFLDPETFIEKRSVRVTLNGRAIAYLNELEYIDGKVWANVYGDDHILIINPENGVVEGVVDCTGILPRSLQTIHTDVFNGIAHNPANGKIYVTGKYWPQMYRITLKKK